MKLSLCAFVNVDTHENERTKLAWRVEWLAGNEEHF